MKYELVQLNLARNALRYIIKAFNITEIYIPYYICPTVRTAIKKENCKIINYHIDKDFKPKQAFKEDAFILYPNYFGICSEIVQFLAKKYKNLIVDNAHSFYSEPVGIASFNSIRKFFPTIRNGSFLYTTKIINTKLNTDNYIYDEKNLTYEEICKNEQILDKEEIKIISKTTKDIFSKINLEKEKQRRINKFYILQERFKTNFRLKENDAPFSFPLILKTQEEANKIVEDLKKEETTIYRYWNNLPDSFIEKIFYTNLVSIPL